MEQVHISFYGMRIKQFIQRNTEFQLYPPISESIRSKAFHRQMAAHFEFPEHLVDFSDIISQKAVYTYVNSAVRNVYASLDFYKTGKNLLKLNKTKTEGKYWYYKNFRARALKYLTNLSFQMF